jgi:hypothetical protein
LRATFFCASPVIIVVWCNPVRVMTPPASVCPRR